MATNEKARRVRSDTLTSLVSAAATGADVSLMLSVAAARVMVDDCNDCQLGSLTPDRVPYEGGPSSMMLVGEAPGAQEAKEGRPFVGRSGSLLRSMLSTVGITEYAVGNTIACRPPSNDYEVAVQAGAPDACHPHLDRALDASGAWIVVAVGGKAAAQFGWLGTVSSAVGRWRWVDGRLHTTIWHPSYILRRGGSKTREFRRNIEVLTEVHRATQGITRYVPTPLYDTVAASSIGVTASTSMVRQGLAKSGYVPVHSKVLDRNVVIYDRDRLTPGDEFKDEAKLPPGFNDALYFTVDELLRLKRPVDVQRVAALKDVINVEVVA